MCATLLAVGGCGRKDVSDEAASAPDSMLSSPAANEPASLTEIAPGDTAAILSVMRRTMQEIDDLVGELERRDTTLEPVGTEEPRRLSVWIQNGVPRKLLISEPNNVGAMKAESQFWLVGGELRVVQQPFAAYVMYGDRILVWTDGALDPVPDIPDADRMAREVELVAAARRWLDVFGLAGGM